jgi:hypothetical protein
MFLGHAEESQVKGVTVRGVRRLIDEADVSPTCVHLRQMGIYVCSQLSHNWIGWRIIQQDSHLLGPPLWPLQDDSRKEIIEIHLDRLILAHLEALRLQRSRWSILGSTLHRDLFNKKTSAALSGFCRGHATAVRHTTFLM